MLFIRVVCGRPNGRLRFSGVGSKMAWLTSAFSYIRARCPKKVRRRDLKMDKSGGWMSAFLTLVYCINPLYIRLVNCPAFRSIKR